MPMGRDSAMDTALALASWVLAIVVQAALMAAVAVIMLMEMREARLMALLLLLPPWEVEEDLALELLAVVEVGQLR